MYFKIATSEKFRCHVSPYIREFEISAVFISRPLFTLARKGKQQTIALSKLVMIVVLFIYLLIIGFYDHLKMCGICSETPIIINSFLFFSFLLPPLFFILPCLTKHLLLSSYISSSFMVIYKIGAQRKKNTHLGPLSRPAGKICVSTCYLVFLLLNCLCVRPFVLVFLFRNCMYV